LQSLFFCRFLLPTNTFSGRLFPLEETDHSALTYIRPAVTLT
jgi:hypothetical protein